MDSRQHAPLPVNPVGDLLRGWRNRRAMSQADLAFEAGISIKHLSYVETGKAAGSRDILLQLASALGQPWKQLVLPLDIYCDLRFIVADERSKRQIVLHRQLRQDSATLRHLCDPTFHHFMRP